ncbi:MAG TPA: cell wall hydrolase [Phycisphaerae bacterium]|nr:cell wall hydrolase [Phycisphaerae bacterium]
MMMAMMAMMNWAEFDKWSAALCAWREARGEGRDGIRAVIHVIANRQKSGDSRWQGKSWAQIVYQRLQFSSMTYPQDQQLCRVPSSPDPVFVDCYEIADAIYSGLDFDLTQGATHYFADSIPMPDWAKTMTETVKLGHHTFYK